MSVAVSVMRDGRGLTLVLAALWLLGAGVPALEAGDLRVQLDAEAGVRNDGNAFQADPGTLEPEDESIARGGLVLKLSYTLPRTALALAYAPAYEHGLDSQGGDGEEDLSGTSHRLELGLDSQLTRRLAMRIRERLLQTPTLDLYVPVNAPDPTAATRRGDQLSHALDVSFDQDLTRRTSLILGAEHTLHTFESQDLSDTETLAGRLGWSFDLTEDRSIAAIATAGQFEFERGEADVQTFGLSYSDAWGRDGHWSIEAGAFFADSTQRRVLVVLPDASGVLPATDPETAVSEVEESDSGWRGGLQASQRLRFVNWNVGYRHDVSAGYGLGQATEADSLFADVSRSFGRRLTLGLDGNASRHRDLGDLAPEPAGTGDDLLNEFAAGTARFSWNILQDLRLTGGYSYIWQESEVEPFEDLSYSRYFLGLGFRIFSFGDTPNEPDLQGEPTDEEPDAD